MLSIHYLTRVIIISALSAEAVDHLAKADWLVGVICAIAVSLLVFVLVCIVKRNRGGKYTVHEKEVAQGCDFEEEGFEEYSKA